jgi:hypothetical protein
MIRGIKDHLENLSDWVSDKIHTLTDRFVSKVEFSIDQYGNRSCVIMHSEGGSHGLGTTYTRAAMNALHLALNVLPRANEDFSHVIYDSEAPEV